MFLFADDELKEIELSIARAVGGEPIMDYAKRVMDGTLEEGHGHKILKDVVAVCLSISFPRICQ